ncbi:MAG: membrane dipeptidase [Clostridiales bacterium]|nr:membrane dipeptidase [Clostridiales bacterium]
MKSYYIIDSHCDTIGKVAEHGIEAFRNNEYHVSVEGLRKGKVGLQFFAAWINQKANTSCLQQGLRLIDSYYTMLSAYPDALSPIRTPQDLDIAIENNMIGAMLTVEGGEVLEGNLLNLRILYQLGVRAMTLTWNYRNEIADGAMETFSNGGLSLFGHDVVREMNKLGMIIDVSHLTEKGFYDVLEVSERPIAATHSNAWSIQSHLRNLKDKQIRLLAEQRGIVGINFYPPFLSQGPTSVSDIIKHIEYISALVGVDVIGFGADFDGIGETPTDIKGPQDYDKIINALLQLNYSEDDVKKIAFENYKRFISEVL